MRSKLGLGDAEDVGFQTLPVFLAVPEKSGIIGAVFDVLPEKLSLRLLPGLGRHNQTVEVASFSG